MPRLNSMRLIPLPKMLAALLLVLSALLLSGCFHSDDDDDPVPVNPTGYYINNTGSVDDLQALVYDNRIMMLSAANGRLYDGIITRIDGNGFTADFMIYTAGKDPVTTTASGTIITGSSISGTLNGSGVGSGAFALLYANTNNQAAAVARAWQNFIAAGGVYDFRFTISDSGSLTHDESSRRGLFDDCDMNGTVTPVSGTRLYSVDVVFTDCNDLSVNGENYIGLATTRDEGAADDRLVYMVSNGSYTLSGEFEPN